MFDITFRKQRFGSPEKMIERLKRKQLSFSIRLGSECTEIILFDTIFVFTSTSNFPREKLFLFNLVKKDALKFLKGKKKIEMPNEFPVTKFNPNYPYDRSIGVDLNHAYWRIAYLRGIITEKTYTYGLSKESDDFNFKALRLATISVLGREKVFETYGDDGNGNYCVIDKVVTQKESQLQKDVFKYIRLVCYDMMHTIAMKLGRDFDCWKTDCIYFHDTQENRKLVTDYFEKKQMDYKILDFFDKDENEDDE